LYFATHLANDWDQGRANYTGAHLLRYDLRSGQFGDLGLLRSQHTCYAGLAIDPAGRWAYNHVCSWDKSYAGGAGIVRTDLATGHRLDLGDAPGLGKASCFYLFADSRGDCWFAKQGRLFAARAAEGKIDVFDRAMQNVPALDAAGNITPQPAYGWEWGQDIGDGQRFICTLMRTERETLETLYEFDPRKVASGQSPFRPIAHIGQTNLGMALGGQRVYFVRRDDGQRQPKGENHHLHSVAWTGPCAGQVIDHGRILDQDGRWPWRVESMAADANGRVFLIGDWYLLKDEREQVLPGERRRQSLRLPEKWAPQDPPQYDRLFRGQFFAAADVSKDLP
jgi:hypothetical protein